MRETRSGSIISRVNAIGQSFTLMLIVFMLVNLAIMFIFQMRYDNFVHRVESITSLKPIVYENIPDDVWEVIAGRISFSECKAYAMIDSVNSVLMQNPSAKEETALLVVQRAMETMRQYVSRIEAKIASGAKIDESQKLLGDLRDVGSLARDMLEDYVAKVIEHEAESNRRAQWVFGLCCMAEVLLWGVLSLGVGVVNKRLSNFIKDQIHQLSDFAGNLAGGDLDARAPALPTKELEPLTESLNVMAERLNDVIAQNKIKQENLKKSEMRMLQAQINPHFLYNTLDAIMWQAEAKNTYEVIHITRALSDFFRISLSSGEEWITVAQEKRHLEGYLSIQKVRYRDILEYSLDIDEDIQDEIVLKLLLQPLVENALYHGIKLKRGGGRIQVTGRREGDELYFCVLDSGVGIPPDRLESIRQALKNDEIQMESDTGSGFGLKNVDLRIRLYYKKPQGLTIESDQSGTRVSFRLPAGMKGKGNV